MTEVSKLLMSSRRRRRRPAPIAPQKPRVVIRWRERVVERVIIETRRIYVEPDAGRFLGLLGVLFVAYWMALVVMLIAEMEAS